MELKCLAAIAAAVAATGLNRTFYGIEMHNVVVMTICD